MKAANFIFKIAAIVLAVAAVVCCILANLEKITDGFLALREQLAAKREAYCCQSDDFDEYEDWDM
jgi:hypothetical protein